MLIGGQAMRALGRGATFASEVAVAAIDIIHEGRFDAGKWIPGRLFSAHQSQQGRHVRIAEEKFEIQRVWLYKCRRR